MQIVDGQPATGSPKMAARRKTKTSMTIATKDSTNPMTAAKVSGMLEKSIIPSTAYANRLQKFHFVSPCRRSMFSNSIHFVRKPIQPKIPLEKRLYSCIDKTASTICLVISR